MRAVRDAQLLVSTTVPNFVLALTLAITTYNILKMTLKYHNFPGLTIKFHDFPGLENWIFKFPGFPRPVGTLVQFQLKRGTSPLQDFDRRN